MKGSPAEKRPDLDAVVSAVAASKKYRAVCRDTIGRIAARELAAHSGIKATVKATKRRLHQVYGAFEQSADYDAAYGRLQAAYSAGGEVEIEAACRHALGLHSSTRERLSILEKFYPAIFEVTGWPVTLLDLGCGLNPLALPWMNLPTGTRYVALDIDAARVRFLNRYLPLAGLEPLARCQDVLSHPPDDDASVALMLKLSTSLERQEPGATLGLVEQLRTPCVVVSFATKSLGGREKGMAEQYQRQFRRWIADRQWAVERLEFETELVFVMRKEDVKCETPGLKHESASRSA
jgi:16S rRNA (guanine(1405)-N(7))-methyltransferase